MPRDVRAYLFDMRQASAHARQFIAGKTLDDYRNDVYFRSAVERQLALLGEALNQLLKVEPSLGQRFSERRRLIAFRNRLIHGYSSVDDDIVWSLTQTRLSALIQEIDTLLDELDARDDDSHTAR